MNKFFKVVLEGVLMCCPFIWFAIAIYLLRYDYYIASVIGYIIASITQRIITEDFFTKNL